jgi:hypothetical protein
MGRKNSTYLLMLLTLRYNTPFLTGPSLHFTALHLTSLHFNSLHFLDSLQPTQFTTLITHLTLFLKAVGLQGRVPKISTGNRMS